MSKQKVYRFKVAVKDYPIFLSSAEVGNALRQGLFARVSQSVDVEVEATN